jgi:hypothetical protein
MAKRAVHMRVEADLWRAAKLLAVQHDTTVTDVVQTALREHLAREGVFDLHPGLGKIGTGKGPAEKRGVGIFARGEGGGE